ncbi:MAG: GDSL-type esterase/lipase family protein [Pseudonocardia sp.]|nr:GDSL-type esterase/lipase family protein [Pseudonocardia sp.]
MPNPRRLRAAPLLVLTTLLLVGAPIPAAWAQTPLPAAVPLGLPLGLPTELPTAVVALGDSTASGEGADDYEPGTRGEAGNWCHRSANAFVHRTGLARVGINLACSGADSADVGFAAPGRAGEASQAARLREVARTHRVVAVTLQVGANDEPALTRTAVACIRTFVDPTVGPCRETVGAGWAGRLAAMAPRVEGAVRDVRRAMRDAGYADDGYAFVLASYASPITEAMGPLHGVEGCPLSRPDAGWGRTVAFPQLAAALRGVADRTGVRFLDLSRAAEGHEACSRPTTAGEWARRITVDPHALVYGRLSALGQHLFQESFHPNAEAHGLLGGCLGEFVATGARQGACEVTADGGLHASPGVPPTTRAA